MTFAPERNASRRDTLIFLGLVLLSIIARSMPPEWGMEVAERLRMLAAPLTALQHQAELTRTSRARFARVAAERDSFALVADSLSPLRAENQQLRAMLGLRDRLPVTHVAAEVLHQSMPTDGFTLLLSAGQAQGVRELAPVVAPGGLVGVVISVEARTSVIMAWAHPDFRASAMILDGSVFGLVEPVGGGGPNQMLMELTGVPYREQVAPGTPVFTSGLGGVYPRGILLGHVLSVAAEAEGWSRTYLVRPAVHPASVAHAMILLGPGTDLQPSFGAGVP